MCVKLVTKRANHIPDHTSYFETSWSVYVQQQEIFLLVYHGVLQGRILGGFGELGPLGSLKGHQKKKKKKKGKKRERKKNRKRKGEKGGGQKKRKDRINITRGMHLGVDLKWMQVVPPFFFAEIRHLTLCGCLGDKRMHQIVRIDFEIIFFLHMCPLRHPLSPQVPKLC